MLDRGEPPARLITRETRPDLYAQLQDSWRSSNDNMPPTLEEFRRMWRRKHPVLAFLSWVAESNWRIASMFLAALTLGLIAEKVLP